MFDKLHASSSEKAELEWDEDKQRDFTTIKDRLYTPPLLAYQIFYHPFIVERYASGKEVGDVIVQKKDDGHEHPINLAIRTMKYAEIISQISIGRLCRNIFDSKVPRVPPVRSKILGRDRSQVATICVSKTRHPWTTCSLDGLSRIVRLKGEVLSRL